jgi:predicted metal-dependent hydrolase
MADPYKTGLEHLRAGRFFAAHEELELAWRAAPEDERDFYQGLVHVAVAWYQAGRGNHVGATRQLEKGLRRLERYEPVHEGVDVAEVRRQLRAAQELVLRGSLDLPAPRLEEV